MRIITGAILLVALLVKISFSQTEPYVIVLGIAQDGGYPHIGCTKQCCSRVWGNDSLKRLVVSLAVVDPANQSWWLFEATPDITEQFHLFNALTQNQFNFLPNGIFITHAHIGHYTGLMYLGREAMNTQNVPVYILPKMKSFLENNGPWSQLVNIHNIKLNQLAANEKISLNENISVEAFIVPHRDEYSETAGFRVFTGKKKYLFIPDIDKWSKF
jgi:pyrroloquinoline quinone biosynthesis protein B